MFINKNILFVFILSVITGATFKAFSMDCELAKAMTHGSLAGNQEFWERFSKLNSSDDRSIRALINEFSPEVLKTQGSPSKKIDLVSTANSKILVEVVKAAQKEIARLTAAQKSHFDTFLKTLNESGTPGLKNNPGKWHYEKLPQYGPQAHSVRLDIGYRVLFDVEKNGAVSVREVNNTIGHK